MIFLNTVAILWAVILGGSVLYQVVKNLFLSPLSKIPGPFFAKFTTKWLTFIDLAGNRTTALHELHRVYGTAVRIAPNEISFSDPASIKDIYGQQTTFMKAPIYDTMSVPPFGIFSMRNRADHSHRRRLLSHAFAQSSLFESEPLIKDNVKALIRRLDDQLGMPVDVMSLFRLLAFDVVGELFLGQSFGGLASKEPPQFLHDMDLHFMCCAIEATSPLLYAVLSRLPIPPLQHFFKSRERLVLYGQEALSSYLSQYGRESGRKDLLTKVVALKTETGTPPLSDRETYTEIGNLVAAGTDTTSMTLTYMFWQLAKNPSWQQQLRRELQSHLGNEHGIIPSFNDVNQLPILNATIHEALRLHPAAPASLPRETPKGGKVLNGYFIPQKTIVSMQCYTTHRDPDTFPDPDNFDPARWLDPESEKMRDMFMPFSKGPRACLGKNLAMMELKLTTATLVKDYTVKLAASCTDDSMAMTDHFLIIPKGGKCELLFSVANRKAG
ncbi:hypothetical protein LTR84_006506 [Exophiala bonariae]|uniref:Cytochrome P450 n=1 Tax=Exophiala bonariae TaxID=1690606 RepID=A0AAV9N0K8_9EURO|nr:hypothetical protein LTR84_006506 [Exophiala bonariae]